KSDKFDAYVGLSRKKTNANLSPCSSPLFRNSPYWGFIVLLVLMAYITLNDVMRILRLR
ncbi:MAG: hypothetical protein FD145_286, partial [Candidatus Saganbacteria bacterium]